MVIMGNQRYSEIRDPQNDTESINLGPLEAVPLARTYTNEDIKYERKERTQRTRHSRFSGWRGGVLVAVLIASIVLLINVILAIVAATVWKPVSGIATAYTGDCGKARGWTTAIHLLINLLSSLLLGASNYCMQRLVSPTRKELDDAHAKHKWLDIGMPSVRNLSSIHIGRTALWFLLAFSSMPLHFLYNSVVFETIAANNVDFLIVAPDFFTNKEGWNYRNNDNLIDSSSDNFITRLQDGLLDEKYLNRKLFDNLTEKECIAQYGGSFITGVGAGFAVPVAEFRESWGLNASHSLLLANSGSGDLQVKPYNGRPDFAYCLSEIVPQRCQIQFSLNILIVVIVANVLKVSLLSITLWYLNQETLVTVGDTIRSFLERPDPTTIDCCLMSRHTVDTLWTANTIPETRANQRWQPRSREPWFGACSVRRWVVSLLLYAASITVAGALLGLINNDDTRDGTRNGFGKVNPNYIIDVNLGTSDSIIPYVLLANLPQTVISFLYLTYNGLFTCMLAGREWAQYAVKRASLRVTIPRGGQRSTYFLQLPYMWSIPLLVASILLHWFVSQSIFLARIAVYKDGVPVSTFDDRLTRYHHLSKSGSVFSGVGYSDTALLASIGWGSWLVGVCVLIAGICTYPKGLPVGGTNSAVISAACHVRHESDEREGDDVDVADKPVKWGVTIEGARDKIGHCCFSSRPVEKPRVGYLYAGLDLKLE
ncbi:hypothetical protein BCR34DRAFT_513729 [Clohesyomyces aquaticus]|uniref:DUF6536 domain-containing protein n=1 Tax=Clohesyomyces aquaticus TaxID=1231657 RepID=A0A1Y1ZMM8_9PLEO|nr:hypothetical protein BCR34DRAFT_513729 [Clohesyomyces aquaticus]